MAAASGSVVYDQARMYGAQTAFAARGTPFIRGEPPVVLTAPAVNIHVDYGNITGPLVLGEPARVRFFGSFNPSLVAAPAGLCRRCAFVASLRVEALHQCDSSSPLFRKVTKARRVGANAYYRGTAIVVLDDSLNVLGYTWLITSHNQIHDERALKRWTIPVGVSDAFAPSWGHAIYDVRLINIEGRIFATYVCHGCNFGLLLVHITASATADGGLIGLRAWRSQRFVSDAKWARGRNQAVFAARRSPLSPTEVFVQPWFSLVASFGVPHFVLLNVSCYRHVGSALRRGIYTCMHNPRGSLIQMEQVNSSADTEGAKEAFPRSKRRTGRRGRARRARKAAAESSALGNGAESSEASVFGSGLELVSNLSRLISSKSVRVGPHRISTTAHLVRIEDGNTGREALLGIAHIRRGVGDCMEKQCTAKDDPSELEVFRWGHHYTHFFYALTAHAPFRMISTSREFCIASTQDPLDCESVQFVSGLALRGASTLLMAYGVNDCEAKVAELPVLRVWEMLQPLPADLATL